MSAWRCHCGRYEASEGNVVRIKEVGGKVYQEHTLSLCVEHKGNKTIPLEPKQGEPTTT